MLNRPSNTIDTMLKCCAAAAVVLAVAAGVSAHMAGRARLDPGYHPGDSFTAFRVTPKSESTLLVWVQSECGACKESAALYRKLTARPSRTRIVFAGPEPIDELRQFLKSEGIQSNDIVSTDAKWFAFRATPTILLLDGTDQVRRVWFGRITDQKQEAELLQLLD